MKSAGLDFKDILIATGSLPATLNLGMECADILTKVSYPKLIDLKVSDRVYAAVAGAFATHIRTSARGIIKIPRDLDSTVVASLPSVFATVYCYLSIAESLKLER